MDPIIRQLISFIVIGLSFNCCLSETVDNETSVISKAFKFPFKQLPFTIDRLVEEPNKVKQLEKLINEVETFLNQTSLQELNHPTNYNDIGDSYVYGVFKRLLELISFQEVKKT